MIEIYLDESFKRSFKKIVKTNPDLKNKFKEKLEILKLNPFHPSLRSHKLGGQLKDYFAFSIDYKTRVLFQFIRENTILLIEIGFHDFIY